MSSLFKRIHSWLRKGHSSMYEDLLTEVIADVFDDKARLVNFAELFLNVSLMDPTNIIVTTQKSFLKLHGHDTDSRPDLVIQFKDNNRDFILLFENKLEASEGDTQLKRYAEHLGPYQKQGFNAFLIYITRYDEPKNEKDIFINGVTSVFVQTRWYKLYNWLKSDDVSDSYIKKITLFMEELGLDQSRRFLPQDMYAIQEMNRLQRMMDECLDGPVEDTMTALFGRAIGWSNRNVQLRDYDRYFKVNYQDNNLTWVGCGFYITDDEYPLLSVIYGVSPNYPNNKKDAINAMKDFINNNPSWEGVDLDDDSAWSCINYDKYILDFLKEEDHIIAIQDFFIKKLKELYDLKTKYPNLNWK